MIKLKLTDLSAEAALLGACLIEPKIIGRVLDEIQVADFHHIPNQKLFDVLVDLFLNSTDGQGIDFITVRNAINTAGIEKDVELDYLRQLYETTPTAANWRYYAGICKDYAQRRKIIQSNQHIYKLLKDGEPTNDIQSELQKAALSFDSPDDAKVVNVADVVSEINFKSETGINTGFCDLDQTLNGFKPGQLIVIGARPGVGKTALAGNIAANMAGQGKHVAFVSLEMTAREIMQRLILSQAKTSLNQVRDNMSGKHVEAVNQAKAEIKNWSFTILDYSSLTPEKLRTKIKTLNARKKIDCLFVDYCQLMTAKADSTREKINEVTRQTKLLAKDENLPVVLLSQLNRTIESRSDQMPRISDLKESGSLEQDADVVLLLHRQQGETETKLIIAKNRGGNVGVIDLVFFGHYYTFESCCNNYK